LADRGGIYDKGEKIIRKLFGMRRAEERGCHSEGLVKTIRSDTNGIALLSEKW